MANCYIDFDCKQQALARACDRVIAEGASVLYARFALCEKWNGLTVYARFKHGAAVYDVPIDEEGAALIPWEVVRPTGFEVSVWGENADGDRLTSRVLFVDVARTISLEGCEPIPSNPTLIQAFIDRANASAEIAEELQRKADAGEFDGEQGPAGEKGDFGDVSATAPLVCTDKEIWIDSTGAAVDYALVADGEGGVKWEKQKLDYPLTVKQGGTGATDAATARENLEITPANIGAAAASHKHAASEITSGVLPIERGGTGGGSADEARGKLGAAAAVHSHGASDIQDLQALRKEMGLGNTLGVLPEANGGTGATSFYGAFDKQVLINLNPCTTANNYAAGTLTAGVYAIKGTLRHRGKSYYAYDGVRMHFTVKIDGEMIISTDRQTLNIDESRAFTAVFSIGEDIELAQSTSNTSSYIYIYVENDSYLVGSAARVELTKIIPL